MKHYPRFFLLLIPVLLALLPALPLFAQRTIDPGTPPPAYVLNKAADSTHHNDTTRFHFTFGSTGTINHSNSQQSYVLANALKLSLLRKSSETNLTNNWIYGRQNAVLTNDDISSTLDWSLYKTIQHFYYWGIATYNHSVPLQIIHQGQAGAGPGYNFIDKKKAILTLTDGILFEINDLYDSLYGVPGGNIFRRDRYHTFRNSIHLMFHWVIGEHYTFDGSGFLQNSLENWSNDYILRITGSASIKLYKWISFTASGAYSKFTRTRGRNTLVTFGVTITR